MNRPVLRLYGLVVVLFGLLVAFTSRWTVFEAEALRDNELNRRELLQEQRIRRGSIRAAGGEVLARSVRGPGDTFGRRYPAGLYEVGGMRLYTNRGVGVTLSRLRANCPPEITVLTLRSPRISTEEDPGMGIALR